MPRETRKESPELHEIHKVQKTVLSIPASILLSGLMISVSILLGTGVLRLKGVTPTAGLAPTVAGVPTDTAPLPTENPGPFDVSLDDDPVLGDKNAPLTMVEFSDYECPFCKQYFDTTYSQIKTEYVDTGKLKIVFRDLPLSFHQNAAKQAEAANCAREQGGDEAYFKMHDIIFTKTTSGGTGLALTALPDLATQIGINGALVKSCMDSGKYTEEVNKDLADAANAGATGTPTFFIGKSSGDTITAMKLVGAQPYSAFKALIDQQLAQ